MKEVSMSYFSQHYPVDSLSEAEVKFGGDIHRHIIGGNI